MSASGERLDCTVDRIVDLVVAEVEKTAGLRAATGKKPETAVRLDFPVGVSARHIHLSAADFATLFGPGRALTRAKDLSQPGQFAAEEKVTVIGPDGRCIEGLRVLGPLRSKSQVELSATDARSIGVKAPLRESGDTAGSAAITVAGPAGALRLAEGCIVAKRHIHFSPADAARFGVSDKEIVSVELGGERPGILGGVVCRVSPDFSLDFHIDTDEANAMGVGPGARAGLAGRG